MKVREIEFNQLPSPIAEQSEGGLAGVGGGGVDFRVYPTGEELFATHLVPRTRAVIPIRRWTG